MHICTTTHMFFNIVNRNCLVQFREISVEPDLGCTSRIYFDNVTLTLHNLTLTSQKPCQYNNKFDCSETNGYNIQQNALNEV